MADYCCDCYREHLGMEGDDFAHLTGTPGNWGVICEGCGYLMIVTWEQPVQYGFEVRDEFNRPIYWSRHEYMAELYWERLWDRWNEDREEFGFREKFEHTVEVVQIFGPRPLFTSRTRI